MKKQTISLFTIALVSCSQSPYDERLEGIWWSNKEMTFNNTDITKLNKETRQFIEKNLGDLGFIYKKDKNAPLSKSNKSSKIKYEKYKLIKKTNNSVTISSLDGLEIKLTFNDNCYYVDSTLGLNEYFCKE